MAGISILPYETIPTDKYIVSSKQDKLVSGENIKTVNGETILGEGDLDLTPDALKSFITIAPLNNSRVIIDAFNKYSLNKKLGKLIPAFIKKESFDKDYTLAILVVEDYTKASAGYRLTFTLLGTTTNAKSSDMESIYSPDVFNTVKVLSYLYSESMGYVIPLGEGEIKDRKMLAEAKRYVDAEIQKVNNHLSESLEDVGISEETVQQIISTIQSSLSDDIENINKQVESINTQVENINANKITHIIPISYDSLVQLRNSAKLIPGQQYRITDYLTTTSQQSTRCADHKFDIIVTADSESTLNENARAIQHEGETYFANSDLNAWEVKYCLDNDTNRFAWADAETYVEIRLEVDDFLKNIIKTAVSIPVSQIPDVLKFSWWDNPRNGTESDGDIYSCDNLQLLADDFLCLVYPLGTDVIANPELLRYPNICLNRQPTEVTLAYDFDRDGIIDKKYIPTSIELPNGRGVIYYMKDEWNNECPYDFKNILMVDSYGSSFTFGGYSDVTSIGMRLVVNNVIKPFINKNSGGYYMELPRISISMSGINQVINNVFIGSRNVRINCLSLINNEFTDVSDCNITVPSMENSVYKAFYNISMTGDAISRASFIYCRNATVNFALLENIEISLDSKDYSRPSYGLNYNASNSKRKVWLDSAGNLVTYCEDELISKLLNN